MTEKYTDHAQLYVDQDMSQAAVHLFAAGTAAVVSLRCPGKQSANEDAAGVIPFDQRSGVLAVADGMGGARGGENAAKLAVTALKDSLRAASLKNDSLRTALLNGVDKANRLVQDLGIGAATTLAAVEVQGRFARPYHVGDSLILVTGQRSRVKLQTVSHSPVGFALEAGVLDEAEAMHHEDRHVVSNMVGTPDMRIEVGSAIELAARDTLLLASDGLSDNLHIQEIIEIIRMGPLANALWRLATETLHRMTHSAAGHPSKPDDLTMIAFRPTCPSQDRAPRSAR